VPVILTQADQVTAPPGSTANEGEAGSAMAAPPSKCAPRPISAASADFAGEAAVLLLAV
jgi:hypothetical protein